MDLSGSSDPYCYVKCGSAIRMSKVRRSTLEPVWNEQWRLAVSMSNLYVSVEVWDEDRLTANDFVGVAMLPLSCISSKPFLGWFPLGANKGGGVADDLGQILIEVRCTIDPPDWQSDLEAFRRAVKSKGLTCATNDESKPLIELPGTKLGLKV